MPPKRAKPGPVNFSSHSAVPGQPGSALQLRSAGDRDAAAVNTQLMYDQMVKAGGKVGQIIYWGKPLDWHNQTLTPNPDTLYFMGFYDTRTSAAQHFK